MGPVSSTLINNIVSPESLALNNSSSRKFAPLSESSKALHDLCAKSAETHAETGEGTIAGAGVVSLAEMIAIQINEHGAQCVTERDEYGQCALHILMDEGDSDCIKTVCEFTRREVRELEGGGVGTVGGDRWISSVDLGDGGDVTPLLCAIEADRDIAIIKMLVEIAGASIREEDLKGCQNEDTKNYLRNIL